ncbi:MAG TPA: prepilin-type N-terminal cleavage/methylation domain-containing protein [Longimicrobiales bacterium]|jgi:prepilin-type N-terminal cleavage/methylation domain-containing protein
MSTRDVRGFTLIELLIVVVIIGILASIAIPKFQSTRQRAYRSALMSDLKNLATQQEVYHNEFFTFSTSMTSLGATTSEGVNVVINAADNSGWGATATHQGITTGQCGIYHGNAAPSTGDPASVVGVVTCNF